MTVDLLERSVSGAQPEWSKGFLVTSFTQIPFRQIAWFGQQLALGRVLVVLNVLHL